MIVRPLSRRILLRGAGVSMALPFLEIMTPTRAKAQTAPVQRFIAFFYPNGTDPPKWNPPAGALVGTSLPECLRDLNGFAAEGIWPAEEALFQDVTAVTGIDHAGVCAEIHNPSMALSAHKGPNPPQATLDQVLADHLRGTAPYRNFALSATTSNDISQGNISFKAGGQPETNVRRPDQLFDTLFGSGMVGGGDMGAAERARLRQQSVLDAVRDDATRLNMRLGAQDKTRIDQYFTAISEVERQISTVPPATCMVPTKPASGGTWHAKAKAFIDLTVLAMACDLTRTVTIQYSDSWGVNYSDYMLGTGIEGLGTWSDHFLSHKLDDTDRATDLDGLDRTEAMRIANVRVVATSRFKVRRFAYLVNSLKRIATASGNLLDESLVMYCSENGDGDSHARKNMPILLAGHAGGFQTGRSVAATNKVTGSLHAAIQNRLGMNVTSYGDPMGTPITEQQLVVVSLRSAYCSVLILCEVLRWKAAEVAELLDTSVASVNSALQRARATLEANDVSPGDPPPELDEPDSELLARYVEAFEQYDMEALTSLIHEDATQSMPPYELWLSGRDDIFGWWYGPGAGCRGSKVIPTVAANGSPAFGQYKPNEAGDGYEPWALQVLEISDGRIVEFSFFLDTKTLFPLFGLPLEFEG